MIESTLTPIFKKITISTWLTIGRICLIPFIVASMMVHQWGLAFILFTVAAITDVIDGALARFLQEETQLGAYLDPLADKLLLLSCYAALAFVDSPLFKVPLWFVSLILIKELILVFGAVYLSLVKHAIKIKPTWLGKITTVVQVFFIWWLFICAFYHWLPVNTFFGILCFISMLTIGSFLQYAYIGYKGLGSWK